MNEIAIKAYILKSSED